MSVAKVDYRHYGDSFENIIIWATCFDMLGQGDVVTFRKKTSSVNNRRKIKKLIQKSCPWADFVQFC